MFAEGNVYLDGAMLYRNETNSLVRTSVDPDIQLTQDGKSATLHITVDPSWQIPLTELVTTSRLGAAAVSKAAYENADSTPLTVDTDYFGQERDLESPCPGPFAHLKDGRLTLKVR